MPALDRKGTSREDEGVGWGRSREAATVLELLLLLDLQSWTDG